MADGDAGDRSTDPTPRGRESIARSLLLWIALTTVAAFTAYSALTVRTTSGYWRASLETAAERYADLILESTRYAMMLNRKEDLQRLLTTVADNRDVDDVRVYDKRGRIIASANPGEVGRQVDMEAEACIGCHGSGEVLTTLDREDRTRVFQRDGGDRVLGVINPIHNAPDCAGSGCHGGPDAGTILGVLDVTMSMKEADASIAAAGRSVWIAAFVVTVLVGFVSASFIYRVVRKPVRRLTEGARRVASGDLDSTIEIDYDNEIGELARAFNGMTADLREARQRLTDWSRDLEHTVVEKTRELARTQRQVSQVEKMASLGRLAATVAHELNNPLAGIVNYARLVERDVRDADVDPELRAEVLRCVDLIRREAARSGDIVRNLLLFARPSEGGRVPVELGEVVDRAVMLVRHHIEMHGIELVVEHAGRQAPLTCDPSQIEQALVALVMNAVEAMPDGGRLEVVVRQNADDVRIEVADTGTGIPPDVLPRIFEPFYTTKEGTSGLGLGLAVVYGIVDGHGGTIEVDSEPRRGTRFRIVLPRRIDEAAGKRRTDRRTEREVS